MIRIRKQGMGGFLNPPGHADREYAVEEYDGTELIGAMSLSYAAGTGTGTWVPEDIKTRCRKLLAEMPGTYTDAWEREVYTYFAHCYSPDGVERNVSKCVIDLTDALNPEHHLAYLHVRGFFPGAKPRLDLIHPELKKERSLT